MTILNVAVIVASLNVAMIVASAEALRKANT
jgi:hypothetical protein